MRSWQIMPLFLSLCSVFALAGCSGASSDGAPKDNAASVTMVDRDKAATVQNAAAPAKAQEIADKTNDLEFRYKWPAQAAGIPALNDWLRSNGDKLLAANRKDATEARADAKKTGYDLPGYSYDEEYKVAADTPDFLVLLSEGYIFTGGAHGMPVNTLILWDRKAGKRVATGALIDMPRFAAAVRTRFCAELNEQRAEKRGDPVPLTGPAAEDEFNRCVDLTKQTVLPLAKDGKLFDSVQVLIGPYEAGPYAEGSYEIDLPMTKALLATVKPEYKAAFTAK